ncbi:MAG: UDP-N-acetylmuramoyl-L-alanine--D-glutamate ligase, partial [Tissierella sp.]|uniref:UDP-N-acetylmuramoyl-L-alanine--D-glutamate ligase n=1 Tax=Tissierella sp. TaxID=41274 RepID=UPI003F99CE8C
MNLKGKNILVMGLGISGISTIKVLYKVGAKIFIRDEKDETDLKEILEDLKDIPMEKYLGEKTLDLSNIDIIIKSPGIPPDNRLLLQAADKNIKVTNDIELGSSLSNAKNIIAITGTNGKTTTTTLTGEIFKSNNYTTFIGGNIGRSIIKEMVEAKDEDIFILETSSFQLEHIIDFKPKISLILNISPDHLDWHGNFENYKKSKKRIFTNQDKSDYTILNYDDEIVKSFKDEIKSNIIWFSVNNKLDEGIFLEDGNIIISMDKKINLLSIDKLLLKGKHNL